ncbi:MAG: alpha/beta hydrolase [Tissierella sp.]
MPAFILDHTADIDSNSYYKAPIDNTLDKYPLVIISHGWKGFRELNTDYAEELAYQSC